MPFQLARCQLCQYHGRPPRWYSCLFYIERNLATMKTNSSIFLKLPANFLVVGKHQRRIHLDQLMSPDLVSQIVLAGAALVIVITILYVLWRTMGMS